MHLGSPLVLALEKSLQSDCLSVQTGASCTSGCHQLVAIANKYRERVQDSRASKLRSNKFVTARILACLLMLNTYFSTVIQINDFKIIQCDFPFFMSCFSVEDNHYRTLSSF